MPLCFRFSRLGRQTDAHRQTDKQTDRITHKAPLNALLPRLSSAWVNINVFLYTHVGLIIYLVISNCICLSIVLISILSFIYLFICNSVFLLSISFSSVSLSLEASTMGVSSFLVACCLPFSWNKRVCTILVEDTVLSGVTTGGRGGKTNGFLNLKFVFFCFLGFFLWFLCFFVF